jgi:3-oxoacyl-[acyl-carrier-protein] synthase II
MYINGLASISAQKTYDESFPEEVIQHEGPIFPIQAPPYKEYIPAAQIRRMGAAVKYGVVASKIALEQAGNPDIDAILTGTGVGCIRDSEQFLTNLLENDEQYLTPTAFIQSTHNTVGAQIALGIGCKAYNLSYVNGASSFEAALYDAHLQFKLGEVNHVLVGGVDEKADITYSLFMQAGLIKKENVGASYSEGAHFFALGREKNQSCAAEILEVKVQNRVDAGNFQTVISEFLKGQHISLTDIDAFILGKNDDPTDQEYNSLLLGMISPEVPVLQYKHLTGEYNTSSGFAVWLGHWVAKNQTIPEVCKIRGEERQGYKFILLYNQYRGQDHSLILLRSC